MMRLFSGHHAISPYEACQELFDRYPLAARAVDRIGATHAMVLMLRDGADLRFFVLSQERTDSKLAYSLCSWPAKEAVGIEADADASISEAARKAVAHGVPLPRHGSIFGWMGRDAITALIVIYAQYETAMPLPRWAVMPVAGIAQAEWPSFTGKPFFGHWFWEYHQDGRIVLLNRLIEETPDTVFWVNTQAILGSDCCAVARDIRSPEGHMLRRGRYVYSETLRAGGPLPSLAALLADPGKTDLAPRFGRSRTAIARPGAGR